MDIKNVLKTIRLQESTISMLFAVIVIVLVGFLGIKYFSNKSTQETILPPIEVEEASDLPQTHIVTSGESLWTIAETYYGTGYNWTDIAEANSLDNANQLVEGQELTIPNVEPNFAGTETPAAIAQNVTATVAPQQNQPTTSPALQESEQQESKNEQTEAGTYTVAKNDSLWKIAQEKFGNGNKWVEIAKANELDNPSVIREGQKLTLSGAPEGQITQEAASTTNTDPSSSTSYTVQSGDSLWQIAQDSYGDGNKWTEIAKANSLKNPSIIHSGNQLTIPQ